jgi:phosphoglycerate dehydrogenase-like enzyme
LQPLKEAGFRLVAPTPGNMPDEAALISALPGCVGWLAGVEPVSERVISAADRLRVISRNGTGIDNLPLRALATRGIKLCRAEGANARGVAELALTLTLAGLRQVVMTHEGLRRGGWPRYMGREIGSGTIGVVGLGAIGSAYAHFCLDLGARVVGYDPLAGSERIVHERFRRGSFIEAVTNKDAVSLHAPMPEDGRPLLSAALFATMSPGTVVVNTARAGLVETAALLAALETGHIACYATDVFEVEPPGPSPLLVHPRTILTSHIGGFTDASVERSTARAVENLLEVLGTYAG